MKIKHYILALCCLAVVSCDKEENHVLCSGTHHVIEGDITAAGAIGDGKTDCSAIINKMIAELPAEGGVIVIPEGDFVLDSPILVNKSHVMIKGLNPGFRSNIDVHDGSLVGPGGGSKLILRHAEVAVKLGTEAVTGVSVKDLLISGGTENNGTGILFESASKDCTISNVIGINLIQGIHIKQAKQLQISDCWICELKASILLEDGENNVVKNCQLGAQPAGVTCQFTNEKNLLFENNQVYPDGNSNLVLAECEDAKVLRNNFKSYYTGILNVKGNGNLIENNLFWLADAVPHQLLDRGADYGVVRLAGNDNQFVQNTLTCEWAVENGVTLNAVEGKGNLIKNCLIEHKNSNQVLLVNQYVNVVNCISNDKIKIQMEEDPILPLTEKVAIFLASDIEEELDDDEKAALDWFKKNCINGVVLTPSTIATANLTDVKVIWVVLDRVGIGYGNLPYTINSIQILTDYYKNGGNLLLTNHATQLITELGRTTRKPGIFGDGEGGDGSDTWVINANIGVGIPDRGEGYDHTMHILYDGLWKESPFGYETFPLIGAGRREDHNCMWDLNAYHFPDLYPQANNVVQAFQEENKATVLATWGHVQDWCCAGLVEFAPTNRYLGTSLAMGLAAYEWNQNSGQNKYQYNVKKLTRNMLSYLATK